MKINSIQTTNVSYKGINLFSKIRSLVSKSAQDTFVKSKEVPQMIDEDNSPSVSHQTLEKKEEILEPQKKEPVQPQPKVEENKVESVQQKHLQQEQLSPEQIEALKIRQKEKSYENYFVDVFKKVHFAKSTDGYCKLLEERLAKNGVKVTFANDAFSARKIYQTIVELQHRGIKVPKEIILMTPIDEDLLGFTPTTKVGCEEFAPIFIKRGIRDDNENISQSLKALGFRHYTDQTARGTIIHEIGHYNHLPLMLEEQDSIQIWKKHFPSFEDEFEFGKKVSAHAITDKTGAEFVAEVFAGLVNGENFDEEVMTLYKELNGPEVS